jgi:Polyketide cyclase / dehydrase and lipid transport
MLKKIGIALGVLVVALVALIASRPGTYRVTRSASIAAPASIAYAQVADFHRWEAWSPWAKLDPDMSSSYAGRDGAVGASYEWKGNDKVGEGRMTLVEARPAQLVAIRLEFLKPWTSTSATRFEFAPAGGGRPVDTETRVTWTMDGESDFMGKAFALFTDLDKMIGSDFERGLANLKTVAESQARATAAAPAVAR